MADEPDQLRKDGVVRRDFLQGAAAVITVAGPLSLSSKATAQVSGPDNLTQTPLQAQGIVQSDPRYYPPALEGMRGSHPGSFQVGHQLRDQDGWKGEPGTDTAERYDLVVVGGGISGLAAAYLYRKKHPKANVLVLDNHDDVGGHAKRNEFEVGGKTLVGYGGTQSIYSHYSPEVISLFSELGIELRKFLKYWDTGFRKKHDLMTGVFFNKEVFQEDRLVRGLVDLPPAAVFKNAPLSAQAKLDLVRLFEEKIDYLPGMSMEEKHHLLQKTSFEQFLIRYAKVHPDVLKYYHSTASEVSGVGADASSAWEAITEGTWFPTYPEFLSPMWNLAEGMALGLVPNDTYGYTTHFPDGNASIARLLVRKLIPVAMPGNTMEDVVTARARYDLMDNPASPARIRLNSAVVKVRHLGTPSSAKQVEVTYVRGGKVERVSASGVVMACYNMIIPRIVTDLPEAQKEALEYQVKVPLVYTNVAIRNWQAIKRLGVDQVYCPSSFYYSIIMDFPVSMGDYKYTASPDEPVLLHVVTHIPSPRELSPRDQRRAGRMFLFTTPFEVFESKLRDQLDRVFGPGGFNSSRDIAGITVNRWPHGYADGMDGLDDPDWAPGKRPNEVGRQKFGRIAIANSDAGAAASTGAAIEQAIRAVHELG